MKATRRAFFGLMGAAPVAAPATLKQLVADVGIPAMMAPTVHHPGSPEALLDHTSAKVGPGYWLDQIAHYKGMLDNVDSRVSPIAVFRNDIRSLDADLATMRCMSLSAKINIQAHRNRKIALEQERSWIEKEIERYTAIWKEQS